MDLAELAQRVAAREPEPHAPPMDEQLAALCEEVRSYRVEVRAALESLTQIAAALLGESPVTRPSAPAAAVEAEAPEPVPARALYAGGLAAHAVARMFEEWVAAAGALRTDALAARMGLSDSTIGRALRDYAIDTGRTEAWQATMSATRSQAQLLRFAQRRQDEGSATGTRD